MLRMFGIPEMGLGSAQFGNEINEVAPGAVKIDDQLTGARYCVD